jgi:hypothetical protein
MPPNLCRKLQHVAQAASLVFAAAKARNISFFALFFADTCSVFGNRQDQDKYETFLRLSKVTTLAPYLAETALFSRSTCLPKANTPPGICFPIVVKPVWGAQSTGVVGIRDKETLQRFLRQRRQDYIVQQFIPDDLEVGVSYTRNPEGSPDHFGVAAKFPIIARVEWKNGFRKLPKLFHYRDITQTVDRERLLELCGAIAATLRTNTFRFDAFVRSKGNGIDLDTLQIIEVNMGVFSADEFLFDVRHPPEFVVEELARRYTYLLLWGGRHAAHPTTSQIRKLFSHYTYCYIVTLYRHLVS